mmetsp:Transcript_151994/g.269282  ORF Transcript_151994/g.269282 Transcript_151994/m.269282 type:complete len:210 (+) Transcript_151994:104-733(+)
MKLESAMASTYSVALLCTKRCRLSELPGKLRGCCKNASSSCCGAQNKPPASTRRQNVSGGLEVSLKATLASSPADDQATDAMPTPSSLSSSSINARLWLPLFRIWDARAARMALSTARAELSTASCERAAAALATALRASRGTGAERVGLLGATALTAADVASLLGAVIVGMNVGACGLSTKLRIVADTFAEVGSLWPGTNSAAAGLNL